MRSYHVEASEVCAAPSPHLIIYEDSLALAPVRWDPGKGGLGTASALWTGDSELWMVKADAELGLWKKVNMQDEERHIALQQYANFIKDLSENATVQDAGSGINNYVAYVARFMLVAMRARQRYGRDVTFDDMIFSCAIIDDFFRGLKFVSCSVRLGFAKALMHMMNFLLEKSNFCLYHGFCGIRSF
ncbi:hypothetical protein Y032_0584g306 [Ancylostoma ceylanicum]|uniref:Uncharacterized protein n=1 Tax=Ancylostoma ceylanicum TaxID=53326 RepID=A0A016WMP1_9BILA|nr:hypothetical protein Y032_0584g306 [Ancylostoma ceylanicum]